MASAVGYVCSLDAASVKKARVELGEEAREREGAVAALRTWLHETPTLDFTTGKSWSQQLAGETPRGVVTEASH